MRHFSQTVLIFAVVVLCCVEIICANSETLQNDDHVSTIASASLTDYERLAANDFKDLLLADASKRYTLDTFESGVWRIGDIQYFDDKCNAMRFPFAQLTSNGDSIIISNPLHSEEDC